MKLVAYESENAVLVGSVGADGTVTPLGEREAFWRDPEAALASGGSGSTSLSAVRQVPAVPLGARVVCVGLNYRNHAMEGGRGEENIPTTPVIFGRWTASLVCDGDECPVMEERYDWEGELGAIVGTTMFRVDAATGLAGVFGYCAFNDLSARSFQRATPQWTMGKNAERSGPMSPITTADEVGDPADGLHLVTRVNGAVMQDDNTKDLIFPVGTLIEYITQVMSLNPGDLIVTGTPAGVGAARRPPVFLTPGDVVEVEIDKVGRVSNRMVAAPPPTA
jgi:2-keto-4-pentenoate hydratase/2-oxohepta-3-ene-1,7-dioic acid hydratase in catechol pathway